ncbi:hypothetical protein Ade02nite_17150 [Paractinoplanes deccanensis]|uniref:Secreted protein n=1 Tax=Paractinoplanes deccanensis TaxID=113561 RepID=A0ABQ3XZB6_9ACTN|nr:hypothetical protein [Actinoplanes deccanensis]GID73074.1 hypothetical protein Ade02nite_17150 [Actinoplanes deccanensis]
MKAATRILTIVGLSLVTGVTMAGPAQAATAGSSSQGTTQTQVRPWDDDDDVVGYYDTRRQCERAGWRGERRDWWVDFDCDLVRRGWHRGDWKLTVDRDDDHDDDDDHHGPWDNRR